jgi:hypothetical protein
MPRSAYYYQDCPTCGRSLQVRVEFLGRLVVCRHCRGQFEAADPSSLDDRMSDSGIRLLQRADELLNSTREDWHATPTRAFM